MLTQTADRRARARALVAEAVQKTRHGVDTNDWKQGLQILQTAAKLDEGYYEAEYQLACMAYMQSDLAAARHHFAAAIARDATLGGDAAVALFTYNCMGELHEMKGGMSDAIRFYNRFLGLYPLDAGALAMAQRLSLVAICCGDWFELYQTACQYQQAGDHGAAASRLASAIELYPGAAFLHVALAACQRHLGLYEEATASLERALVLDPDAHTCIELGHTYAELANPFLDEEQYRRALDINPLVADAWYYLGAAHMLRRDQDGALSALRRAIELAPDAPWAERAGQQVQDILASGHIEMPSCLAEPVTWQKLEDRARGIALPYPAAALLLPGIASGELVRIVDRPEPSTFSISLRRHLAEEADDAPGLSRRVERQRLEAGNLAVISRSRLENGVAIEARDAAADRVMQLVISGRGAEVFELAIHAPTSVYNAARHTFHFIARGLSLTPRRDMQERAVAEARLALERPGVDETTRAGCGFVLLENGDVTGAEKVFTGLNTLHGHAGSGLVAFRQGRYDAAIPLLEKAAALTNPEIHKRLGEAWAHKGNWEKALRAWQRAFELDPQDGRLLQLIGRACEALKRFDRAEQAYRQVLSLEPRHVRARLLLAALLRKNRRHGEALALLEEAAAFDPGDLAPLVHRAACHIELRQWGAAEDALQKAQRIDPMDAQLREVRQLLEKQKR
ncbi:MAG: tetratricopeptide repeat protein [Candidatus Xenobia bacterium]